MTTSNSKLSKLTKTDLKLILNGAAYLGSGGGGSVESGEKILTSLSDTDVVEVITVADSAQVADKYAVMVAYIGSPDSMLKLTAPTGAVNAVRALDHISRDPKNLPDNWFAAGSSLDFTGFVIPAEVGALNTIVACCTAKELGIPVVDADGAGRAVPMLQMLTFSYTDGVDVAPAVLATPGSDGPPEAMSVHVATPDRVEHYARTVIGTSDYESMAGLAMYRMRGEVVANALPVTDTLVLSKTIGTTLKTDGATAACDQLCNDFGFEYAKVIFSGRIIAVNTGTSGGFDDGRVTLQSVDDSNSQMVIYFQNENIVAWDLNQSAPVGLAPNLIAYSLRVDSNTANSGALGFSNADIHPAGEHKYQIKIDGVIYEDPIVDISLIAPHPGLIKSAQYEPIRKAFEDLVLTMGYPLKLK